MSILYALEGIRFPALSVFLSALTYFGSEIAFIAIALIVFWCVEKKYGYYLMATGIFGTLINQFTKILCRIPRPWVRDPGFSIVESARADAGGYSFPSGHVQASTDLIGATGFHYRKKHPMLNVLCWLFVIAVAFSRNFLGVHTPQDIVVGLIEAIVILLLVDPLLDWIDRGDNRDVVVLVLTLIAFGGYLAYITLKPYPMDYDASGALLVDPVEMQVDCFKSAGVLLGAIVGWFMERRILDFETDPHAPLLRKIVRIVVGLAVVVVLHLAPRLLLMVDFDTRWYELIKNGLTVFGASFVVPAVFCAIERRGGGVGHSTKKAKHFK